MIETTRGIILRTRPLTETSLIVHWLTPDLGRLATRTEQRDRRGQKAQRADERHDHPGAGDQPKLRDAGERGRHEGQEAGRGGEGCDQNLHADPLCGRRHRAG